MACEAFDAFYDSIDDVFTPNFTETKWKGTSRFANFTYKSKYFDLNLLKKLEYLLAITIFCAQNLRPIHILYEFNG